MIIARGVGAGGGPVRLSAVTVREGGSTGLGTFALDGAGTSDDGRYTGFEMVIDTRNAE